MPYTAPLLCNACMIADSIFPVKRKWTMKVFFFCFSFYFQVAKKAAFPGFSRKMRPAFSPLQDVRYQPAHGHQSRGVAKSHQFPLQNALCHCSASIRSVKNALRLVSFNRKMILSFLCRIVNHWSSFFVRPISRAEKKKKEHIKTAGISPGGDDSIFSKP